MEGIVWSVLGLAFVGWLFWRTLRAKQDEDVHEKISNPLSFSGTVPRFLFSKDDTKGPLTYDVRIRSKAAPPKG